MKPQPQHEDDHVAIDQIREELHHLEARVDALEHRTEPRAEPTPLLTTAPAGAFELSEAPNAFSAAGRAILGLAGAFLLRAVAESGAVPAILVVAAAILYAATWLVFSVRTRDAGTFAGTVYGVTAALIFAPLLWEATVRFHALTPVATAAILVAFPVLSAALAWSGPGAVSTVTTLAALLTAIALMVETGDAVPFAVALLAIAAFVETIATRGHGRGLRAPAAIAADIAIWLLFYLTTRPGGVPEHYKPVGEATCLTLGLLLLLIYASGIVWTNVILRRPIAIAVVLQAVAAFTLAAGGTLLITEGRAANSVGAICALACAACYFTAFLCFADALRRNHHVFASWGLAFGLTACILILPASELVLIWSIAAVLTTLAGVRAFEATLSLHGTLYLLAAGLVSGLPARFLNAFTGSALAPATPSLWIIAISAVACYAICFWGRIPAAHSTGSALVAAASIASVLILAVVPAIGGTSRSFLATARTLVTCALALAFGFTGAHTGRRELVWICYAAIALGTVKLILEDLRRSQPAALALALVCYGAVLILVPKLSARKRTPATSPAAGGSPSAPGAASR